MIFCFNSRDYYENKVFLLVLCHPCHFQYTALEIYFLSLKFTFVTKIRKGFEQLFISIQVIQGKAQQQKQLELSTKLKLWLLGEIWDSKTLAPVVKVAIVNCIVGFSCYVINLTDLSFYFRLLNRDRFIKIPVELSLEPRIAEIATLSSFLIETKR